MPYTNGNDRKPASYLERVTEDVYELLRRHAIGEGFDNSDDAANALANDAIELVVKHRKVAFADGRNYQPDRKRATTSVKSLNDNDHV